VPVLGEEEGGAGGADKGGGGMTGNALRLALREWEGVLNAVDGGGWMAGAGIDSSRRSFSASVALSVTSARTRISICLHAGAMGNSLRTPSM